ncbi:MAG: UPF0175 family protein [Blastocatellia bacterium]
MEITLTTTIPDDIAASLQNGSTTPLPRRLLELAVIKAYESGLITESEAMNILGFENKEELSEFFKRYDVSAQALSAKPSHQRALAEIGRRQEDILRKVESGFCPEEPYIPEAPISSLVKEFLL